MSSAEVIDIDRQETWPGSVIDIIDHLVAMAPNVPLVFQDLPHHIDFTGCDQWLRRSLAGRQLRVFHATRLLIHEAESIRVSGLRPLTEQLVHDRQNQALSRGYISDAEHTALRDVSLFRIEGQRKGALDLSERVCFASTRYPLRAHALDDQLSNWGGEVQYNNAAWREIDSDRVKKLGRPAVVVALIDGSDPELSHVSMPDLIVTFVGGRLGLHDAGVTIHHRGPVRGEQIEAILHPGDPEYDALMMSSGQR
ncbi:hypothetical protein ACFV8E_39725 [Streptomyces sp. NPDC059849]|uniref:hypothetical protein n=1 Tax=Streptomyces sp. NPDC059849 TaxID=3346969 RepID=UPI003651F55E